MATAALAAAPMLGACGLLAGLTSVPVTNDAGTEAAADAAGDDAGDDAGEAATDGPCDPTRPFGAPTQTIFASGVNSAAPASNYGARLSPDELTIYFTSTRSGGVAHLYFATRASTAEPFGSPALLPNVNASSPAKDEFPSVSADGTTLIWTSSRGNPSGLEYLYIASADPLGPSFGAPMALTSVNAGVMDVMGYLLPDGHELYFVESNAPENAGDIYRSLLSGGTFGPPTRVSELNTSGQQHQHPVATPDDLTFFYTSDRTDLGSVGELDIFSATRADAGDAFGDPVDLPPGVNSPYYDLADWISPDGCRLYFSSDRNGGVYEVFVARRQ